jgi:peroxiredoxin
MLGVGDKAPDFVAEATTGRIEFASQLGRRPVILYFYPKANTSG